MNAEPRFCAQRVAQGAIAAAAAVFAFVAARCGASFGSFAAVLAFGLGTWAVGDALAARLGLSAPEVRSTAALTLGTALFALVTLAASATGWRFLSLVPLVLGAGDAFWGFFKNRKHALAEKSEASALPLFLFAFLLLAYAFGGAVPLAHPSAVGAVIPSQDFFWNLGNAETFALGFPPADLRFAGVTVTYHYLTELVAGGIAMAFGVSCYDVLAFWLPPLVLAGLLLVLAELARLWFPGGAKQRALLPLALFCTGCAGLWKTLANGLSPFWNTFLRHLLTNINSVATNTLFLAAFTALLTLLAQRGFAAKWPLFFTAGCAFLLVCFSKGPVAGVAAIALFLTALLVLPRKGVARVPLAVFTAIVCGSFAVLYATFFSGGAGTSVHFSLLGTLEKSYFVNVLALLQSRSALLAAFAAPLFYLAQAICMAPAAMPLFLVSGVCSVPRLLRLPAEKLFAYAMALGGMAAFFLFDHEAMSQVYFAFAALFFVHLLAIDALSAAEPWLQKRKKTVRTAIIAALGCLVAVSVLTAGCTYAYLVRTGARQLWHRAETVAAEQNRTPLTANEEAAMDWLRAALLPGETFATNRIHTGAALEGLSNVYSGLSGRRGYMESFKYAVSNMGVPTEEVVRRTAVVQTVFGGAPAAETRALCLREGIDYLVWCAAAAGDWQQPEGLTVVYQNSDVTIYKPDYEYN